jgi:hypothetical protein
LKGGFGFPFYFRENNNRYNEEIIHKRRIKMLGTMFAYAIAIMTIVGGLTAVGLSLMANNVETSEEEA